MSNSPGTYVKGDRVRVATTPAEAVQAAWEGFALQEDVTPAKVENASTDVPELPAEQSPATEPAPKAKRGDKSAPAGA